MSPGKSHSQEHEDKCRRCGRCCREKYEVEGIIFYGTGYCRHFDGETRLCKVYEKRLEVDVGCIPLEEGIRRGVLPGDCPYVADRPDYVAPVETWDDPELAALIRQATGEEEDGTR